MGPMRIHVESERDASPLFRWGRRDGRANVPTFDKQNVSNFAPINAHDAKLCVFLGE